MAYTLPSVASLSWDQLAPPSNMCSTLKGFIYKSCEIIHIIIYTMCMHACALSCDALLGRQIYTDIAKYMTSYK